MSAILPGGRSADLVSFQTMTRLAGRTLLAATMLLSVAGLSESLCAPARNKRPRIGLALAGGSARGFAHLGVLKWLSEHRIPLDCIAGASMGGLVAGLYASGFECAEMQEFVREIDWVKTLRPGPAFRDLTYRRKEDRREFPTWLEFGLKGGFSLPGGISPYHGIGLLLSRFTSPYPELRSFDELPTPFRTVAVDLTDGTEFVLEKGSLFDALRATMAIPGVFSPWVVEGRQLIDGGMLNNLPVDLVQAMGAELIIAVPLKSHGFVDEPTPVSLTGVAARSLDIMVAGTELRHIGLAQIVITPELTGFSSMDFQNWEDLAKLGYEAASQKADQLQPLALTEEEWQAYLEGRRRRRRVVPAEPAFLELNVSAGQDGDPAARELSRSVRPPYTVEGLEKALTWITGWGRFEAADYRVCERNGLQGYRVNLREKKHGPPFLNTLLLVDGSQSDGLRLGVGARLTVLDSIGPFSEWRSEVNIGILNRIATELYWRPGGGRWFVAPRSFYDQTDFNVYREGRRELAVEFREPGTGLDVGYAGGRTDEVRFGYQVSRLKASQSLGVATFPEAAGGLGQFRLRWVHEGQDDPMVPRHGVRAMSELRWVTHSPWAEREYKQFESRFNWAAPIRQRNTILATLQGGFATNDQIPHPVFSLGGPFRLSALSRDQIFGSRYYYASLAGLHLLSRQEGIASNFYLGVICEAGRAFRVHEKANPYQDVAVGIVGETPLGLLFAGPSYGENNQWKFSFRLGRLF